VIHCGFIHDFNNFAVSVDVDKRAIEALAAGVGSDRPLIVTSGTAGLSLGRASTEDDAPNPNAYEGNPRVSEQTGLALGGNVMVMRLPPSVHGEGDHGFVPTLINIARSKGVSGYVDAGANRWPAVHRTDAARAYVLALEKGQAGTRYHAVGEEGIAFRDIAEVIGRKLGLPVVSVAQAQAGEHFGWMGRFAGMDVPASSQLTQTRLGWQATGPRLMEDLEAGSYFAA
jgi:nucleoside-diphosphate-sugar epimerase